MAGAEIVTETGADVEAAKFASPGYVAAIEWEPTARLDVSNTADAEVFSVAVPNCVAPSLNATVPVGMPDPDLGATVAVNVIAWPELACMDEADRVVVVAAGEEVCGVKTKTVAEYAGKL